MWALERSSSLVIVGETTSQMFALGVKRLEPSFSFSFLALSGDPKLFGLSRTRTESNWRHNRVGLRDDSDD